MASGTNYSQEYGQAEKAYLESNFAQAAEIIDHLADEFPQDPNVLLLRGHIYCYGFQNYDLAKHQYESVLELSEQQELVDFARSGIEQVEQLQRQSESELPEIMDGDAIDETEGSMEIDLQPELIEENEDFNFQQGDETELSDETAGSDLDEDSFGNPFTEDSFVNSEDRAAIEEDNNAVQFEPEPNSLGEDLPSLGERSESYSSSSLVSDSDDEDSLPEYMEEDFAVSQGEYENDAYELEIDTVLTEPFARADEGNYGMEDIPEQEGLNYQDELEFDEIDSSFFDLEELEQGLPDTGLFNVVEESNSTSAGLDVSNDLASEANFTNPEEVGASEASSVSAPLSDAREELQVDVKQGTFANFVNAPIRKKQSIAAGITGLVSAIAVLSIGLIGSNIAARQDPDKNLVEGARNSLLLSIVAGIASAGTAAAVGNITAKHISQASQDLQNQFDDVYQGNLNAKATVYSQDEFGQLASGFNRMTRVILTTTQEAQRRAEETEQAKEDLQRQVIRLLDDVEGAARGDLTVQATVTADVLGAVADAFNLTIQSLREIVRQVKEAAEQVNKGSTDSELFARNQSSEALRMAEELAVTLNSVQMMTESIERVADNAREAEEVARSSSVTALKGGKAVERTVSGIFQIRETVSETARKVKRLAEASQEISKIVLLISQIAERTNQLALNASIQAAKAGEAGRGFAVVADEVRQLADRSGKSLKEIEQIVLQIQSETGSVMTAMEEGIQEVIDVTERAEQAKTALEDIIQVSNRIDTLVRSITADTVEQRENSRAVAQVMQSVELTAQTTSQESQRVGGALQSLVGIARGLLSSVERFRIDKSEE
ncbi:HAMP domain-containing protein [Pleurocapsales cyanobacterium LEGE 10410]|nr:HAMP domain-containing protein [Pleurocapsales cyanobacterium LEGE 10410]